MTGLISSARETWSYAELNIYFAVLILYGHDTLPPFGGECHPVAVIYLLSMREVKVTYRKWLPRLDGLVGQFELDFCSRWREIVEILSQTSFVECYFFHVFEFFRP